MTKYEWIAHLAFHTGQMSGREQDIARKSFDAGRNSVQATELPDPPVYCNADEKTISKLHLI